MTSHDNVTDIVERLQDVCLDWDGSQMKDAEEPRNWLSVGEIREAASTIATLRKQLANAREALEPHADTNIQEPTPGLELYRRITLAREALKGQP